ncbi:MAG: hypothetical protein EBT51_07685 [Flavobacteriaceae bacterium]|jgi:hypothetical protein|nr:hypothetical protein [Flavobacteriaceae bacterium]
MTENRKLKVFYVAEWDEGRGDNEFVYESGPYKSFTDALRESSEKERNSFGRQYCVVESMIAIENVY